jgi:motility quorum-sensing regulator / GCU-specific mRNA interferase toxin
MEKKKPHYNLSLIRELIAAGRVRATGSALSGGASLGFDFAGVLEVVGTLTSDDFYKSMTTYADHRVWQDVYRPCTEAGDVYLKLMMIEDVLIISFKEL